MRIIIADDEQNALEDLHEVVSVVCPDSQINAFDSSVSALKFIRETPCDIAFLDIEMPDLNGLIFAKHIKELHPKANIIFVTGYMQYALDSYSVAASGYLLKPATPEKVQKALNELRYPLPQTTERIRVQTFGNFEVFVDNVPVGFGRTKSKELLAYLVDRKGASATTRECFAILFEDKEYDLGQERYFQSIVYDMTISLKKAKAQDIAGIIKTIQIPA